MELKAKRRGSRVDHDPIRSHSGQTGCAGHLQPVEPAADLAGQRRVGELAPGGRRVVPPLVGQVQAAVLAEAEEQGCGRVAGAVVDAEADSPGDPG